jgi:probable rRNA maturation factor
MRPSPGANTRAPTVEIQISSSLWDVQPAAEKTVRNAVFAAAAELSTDNGELSILLTDDETIRLLNRDWRHVDKPTNVLSFPAVKTGGAPLIGDIVIAYETLKRECEAEDRDFLHHLAHLTVHGFLHLFGYDHQGETEAAEMEKLEGRIMKRMNMPDPYLASNPDRDHGDH